MILPMSESLFQFSYSIRVDLFLHASSPTVPYTICTLLSTLIHTYSTIQYYSTL